jgi:magnesium chelatase subunit D
MIAELTSSFQVDGHRADIVILKSAMASAAFGGRRWVDETEILSAAELALPHRLRRQPFDESGTDLQTLHTRLEEAQNRTDEVQARAQGATGAAEKKTESDDQERSDDAEIADPFLSGQHDTSSEPGQAATRRVEIGTIFKPQRISSPLDRLTRRATGKRSSTRTQRKRGRYVQSRPLGDGCPTDIAFDATFRQAAVHQVERAHEEKLFSIHRSDLQQKVRVRRAGNCILFAVDASWSMAAAERIEATKGAIMSLLQDAYQRRDVVGLVVFQKDTARIVLQPTSSVELAQKLLQDIPVGGKTPLPSGLWLSYQVLEREKRLNPEVMPMMILLTDGAGNVSMSGLSPRAESLKIADMFRYGDIRSVVINMEHPAFDRGLAQELADALHAPCYALEELRAASLVQTVRDELAGLDRN